MTPTAASIDIARTPAEVFAYGGGRVRGQAEPSWRGAGAALPPPDPPRPRRDDVADAYDLGVRAYEELWSPVILPPAVALAGQLDLTGAALIADVGAGIGALLPAIRAAAPSARIVSIDASPRMLQVARTARGASALVADALALPLGSETADVVILAYVLFHLADPVHALAETARVLRPGGRAGAITWAWERVPRAGAVWDQVLNRAGVPQGPLRTADAGLDSPEALAGTLRSAGLRPLRIWSQPLCKQWDRATYLRLASGLGAGQIRLSLADPEVRAEVLASFRHELDRLGPEDLLFEGEVICAVATV